MPRVGWTLETTEDSDLDPEDIPQEIWDIFKSPNEDETLNDLIRSAARDMILSIAGYWEVDFGPDNIPQGLGYVDVTSMKKNTDNKGKVENWVQTTKVDGVSKKTTFEPNEIVEFRLRGSGGRRQVGDRPGTTAVSQGDQDMALPPKDRDILRQVAGQVADVAALPVDAEKAEVWRRLKKCLQIFPE